MSIDFLGLLAFVIGFGWIPIAVILSFFYYTIQVFIKISQKGKKN